MWFISWQKASQASRNGSVLGVANGVDINPNTFGFILEPLHLNQTDAVGRLVAALDAYVARLGRVTLWCGYAEQVAGW